MIEEGLVAALTANNGGDAIDVYVAGRVFGDTAPPDLQQIPCICFSLVGGSSEPTLRNSGTLQQRIEINALAVNPDEGNSYSPRKVAGLIRAAVIARLNGWQQQLGDGTDVLNTTLLNPGTDFVTEQRIFRCMCEFYVLYTLP